MAETALSTTWPPWSAEWLRLVLDQAPAILWTTDRDLRITSSAGAGLARLNLRPNETNGLTFYEYFQTNDPEFPSIAAHLRVLAGESATYPQQWGGNEYHAHVEPLRTADGTIIGCVGVALDVTDLKRAERRLADAHAALERVFDQRTCELQATEGRLDETTRLLAQFFESQEIGRRVAADKLHDRILPGLTAAWMELESAEGRCHDQPARVEEKITAAVAQIKAVWAEARRVSEELWPPMLNDLGVVAAVTSLVQEAQGTIPNIRFVKFTSLDHERLEPMVESTIYRIVQEALDNACRHSGARTAVVELRDLLGFVRIRVQDWGRGFCVSEVPRRCYGLAALRERAAHLGSKVILDSVPGKGTTLVVDIPRVARRGESSPASGAVEEATDVAEPEREGRRETETEGSAFDDQPTIVM